MIIKLSNLKEPAAFVKKIHSKIRSRFSNPIPRSPFCQLSNSLTSKNKFDITVDEQLQSCQVGKHFAQKIMTHIKYIPAAEVKEKMLPLQGHDLWHKWANLDKEQNRMKSGEIGRKIGLEQFVSGKKQQKRIIRKMQSEKMKPQNRSPVMTVFIQVLLQQTTDVIAYFLQWLKFYLDDRSCEELPDLQKQCKSARERYKKTTNKIERDQIQQELCKYDKELIHASFGVEHLFRELGQMYECVMEQQTDPSLIKEVNTLCTVVAHLLMSGFPLEIVDGDAAHIPQRWVTDILENIKPYLKTPKLAILSVLGI